MAGVSNGSGSTLPGKLPLKYQLKLSQKRCLELEKSLSASADKATGQELLKKKTGQGRLIAEIEEYSNLDPKDKETRLTESISKNTCIPRKPRVGPEYQATLPPLPANTRSKPDQL